MYINFIEFYLIPELFHERPESNGKEKFSIIPRDPLFGLGAFLPLLQRINSLFSKHHRQGNHKSEDVDAIGAADFTSEGSF